MRSRTRPSSRPDLPHPAAAPRTGPPAVVEHRFVLGRIGRATRVRPFGHLTRRARHPRPPRAPAAPPRPPRTPPGPDRPHGPSPPPAGSPSARRTRARTNARSRTAATSAASATWRTGPANSSRSRCRASASAGPLQDSSTAPPIDSGPVRTAPSRHRAPALVARCAARAPRTARGQRDHRPPGQEPGGAVENAQHRRVPGEAQDVQRARGHRVARGRCHQTPSRPSAAARRAARFHTVPGPRSPAAPASRGWPIAPVPRTLPQFALSSVHGPEAATSTAIEVK